MSRYLAGVTGASVNVCHVIIWDEPETSGDQPFVIAGTYLPGHFFYACTDLLIAAGTAHDLFTEPSRSTAGVSDTALARSGALAMSRLAVSPNPSDVYSFGWPGGEKAFINGEGDRFDIDPNDVVQGRIGDCYLDAGMQALAATNPEAIRRLIKDLGDGTYEVTLYVREETPDAPKSPKVVRIDSKFPLKSADFGDRDGTAFEIWPLLLEKAVAVVRGSYAALDDDYCETRTRRKIRPARWPRSTRDSTFSRPDRSTTRT